jgi:hypothetical protein
MIFVQDFAFDEPEVFERSEHPAHGGRRDAERTLQVALQETRAFFRHDVEQIEPRWGQPQGRERTTSDAQCSVKRALQTEEDDMHDRSVTRPIAPAKSDP